MAPKKVKSEDKAPATPTKTKPKVDTPKVPETPTKTPAKTPAKTPTKTPSRKDKEKTVEWSMLPKAEPGSPGVSTLPLQIEVVVDGNQQAGQNKKGSFDKVMKLSASNAFTVVKTYMITEGEHAGHQAILVLPAKPFEFMKLTPEIRNRIYGYYFASVGIVDDPIVIDGKRATNKQPFAKSYSKGDKNRVALLAANREVQKEASQIFYALPIQCESTNALTEFISELNDETRDKITSIIVKLFQKSTARIALHLLSQCGNLQRLRFATGVFGEADVEKAVKSFHEVAYKFLDAVAAKRNGDKDAAIDVLSFAKSALTYKEKDKAKPWSEELVTQFKEGLKAKLK